MTSRGNAQRTKKRASRRYRWELLPKIAADVEYGLRAQAHRDLAALIAQFKRDSDRLSVGKIRCCQTMSACMRGARRAGADSELIFQEHLALLEDVVDLTSWPQLESRLRAYLDRLFEHLAPPARPGSMTEKLRTLLAELRATLATPQTLEHYAAKLNVSPGHLSRSFAATVGRPFRDEVRRLRNEEACRLLVHSSLKIAEIARRVGVQSSSQFITDFRREQGLTPAAYRRRHPRRRPRSEFAG